MFNAIGKAGIHGATAKMEIRFAGMTHRPFTNALGQIEQSRLVFIFRIQFLRNEPTRRRRRQGMLISRRLTGKPTRTD